MERLHRGRDQRHDMRPGHLTAPLGISEGDCALILVVIVLSLMLMLIRVLPRLTRRGIRESAGAEIGNCHTMPACRVPGC